MKNQTFILPIVQNDEQGNRQVVGSVELELDEEKVLTRKNTILNREARVISDLAYGETNIDLNHAEVRLPTLALTLNNIEQA